MKLTEPVELQTFLIDTVYPCEGEAFEIYASEHEEPVKSISEPKVQMVRYSVLGTSAEDAFKRFIEDEAGVEVERTEPNNFIVVGINPGGNPFG